MTTSKLAETPLQFSVGDTVDYCLCGSTIFTGIILDATRRKGLKPYIITDKSGKESFSHEEELRLVHTTISLKEFIESERILIEKKAIKKWLKQFSDVEDFDELPITLHIFHGNTFLQQLTTGLFCMLTDNGDERGGIDEMRLTLYNSLIKK